MLRSNVYHLPSLWSEKAAGQAGPTEVSGVYVYRKNK